MGVALVNPRYYFPRLDTGAPLAGGLVQVYVAGTTTPTNTWQNEALSSLNTNPIQLDSAGSAVIWTDPTITYKFEVRNSAGSVLYTVDNIKGAEPSGLRQALAASSGSSMVGFIATGTDPVASTVQEKLREWVSVLDFGADPTGVADSRTAFINAIATGRTVRVPKGTYRISNKIQITNPVTLLGDGMSATVIERDYSPSNDWDGIFNFEDGGTIGSIQQMTLRSKTGQTGGCLMSIRPTAAGALGLYTFIGCDFTTTGTSTHDYTIYMDGTAKTSAAIGIRGVDFIGCTVFGGLYRTILVKGVLKFSFVGGGCFPAGGAAGSSVDFDGSASVNTQSFRFSPADCSCDLRFDYAQLGLIDTPVMGAVTNTSNAQFITLIGYSASIQNFWNNVTVLVPGDIVTGNWTPTVTAVVGTITTYTATGSYSKVGRLVTATANVVITNAGTGADTLKITLPFTPTSKSFAGSGVEIALTGYALRVYVGASDATAYVKNYVNATVIANGADVTITVSYII